MISEILVMLALFILYILLVIAIHYHGTPAHKLGQGICEPAKKEGNEGEPTCSGKSTRETTHARSKKAA